MKGILRFLMYCLSSTLFSTMFYIAGRILLPDMGLSAPDWWAWFWATFLVIGPLVLILLIAQTDELRRYRW